uniref:Uncharacterized protein n=1 Tax=Arundo donax TaxID=35708 RepID=A0A0A9DBU2_ARUDO
MSTVFRSSTIYHQLLVLKSDIELEIHQFTGEKYNTYNHLNRNSTCSAIIYKYDYTIGKQNISSSLYVNHLHASTNVNTA